MNKKKLLRLFNTYQKIPKTYTEGLSYEDTKKQLLSFLKNTKRPKTNFKSKPSQYTKKIKSMFGEVSPLELAYILSDGKKKRFKELVEGFARIINKGQGAYYSSGSRPNQSARSWGLARLYSVLLNGSSRRIDKHIVDKFNIPIIK